MTQASPPENSTAKPSDSLREALSQVFGFEEFRSLQEDAIRAATEGGDVLVVMPTGAGKSLCYQLPAAIADGTTLVVSPLVALMRDQVVALQERTGFAQMGTAFLNSSQTQSEQREVLDDLRAGKIKLLYVAPERFRAGGFIEAIKSTKLARLVVDEAHCISQWGHDFRPDYLALKSAVEALGNPPLTAVTATATKRVQASIIANLGMREPTVFIGGFDRPNIHFSSIRCKNDLERANKLVKALPKLAGRGGSGLIYVATRKQCDEVSDLATRALEPLGIKAAPYHAGMDAGARNEIQSAWLSGEIHVLVATNAFGMGIDKPDVRYVIHWIHPESPEAYYQEAGRAGRDGRKSRCVVLFHFADKRLREFFIENDALSFEKIADAHAAICRRLTQPTPSPDAAQDIYNSADFNDPNFNEPNFNGASTPVQVDNSVVAMPRSFLSMNFGWNETTSRAILGKLDHFNVISKLHETGDNTVVRVLKTQIEPALRREITNHLASEESERRARLDEMIGYCKAARCRRKTLLEYFGDEHEATPREYCCDYCDNPEKFLAAQQALVVPKDAPPETSTLEGGGIHALLQNLDALRPRVGRDKLNKILRASKSKDLERFQSHALYGALRGATQSGVTDFLARLVQDGLMAQAGEDEYFVMFVTSRGREVWQNNESVSIALPRGFVSRETLEDSEPGAELFEKLRTWRRKRADEEHVPPYCVLPDKTLRAIAMIQPEDEDALAQVPGIGARKLEKYGDEVLAVVSA